MPESVAFDPQRRVLYVSSFVGPATPGAPPAGFVSRLALDGTVLAREWVAGLRSPSGLAVRGDRLYAVERDGVAEIDIGGGVVITRHALPGAVFPNDVAAAPYGTLYVSDSGRHAIYRLAAGRVEVAAEGGLVRQPNGLVLDGPRLLFGNTGDGCVRALDLATGEVGGVVRLGDGIVDGLRADGAGNLIVSLWHGSVLRVGPDGSASSLLDTSHVPVPAADLEYVASENCRGVAAPASTV